jgi:hypothetical protein
MKTGHLVLVLLLAGMSLPSRAAAQPPMVSVTVSVFNDAGVAPDDFRRARSRAESVMLRAGVSLEWLDCGTPGNRPTDRGCTGLQFPKHLSVRFVSGHQVSGRPVAGDGTAKSDVFGSSFQNEAGEGNYAVVYCDLLRNSAPAKSIGSGDLLGLVVAHELGHLLLGLNSHSQEGLMSPVWREREMLQVRLGAFYFSGAEAGRMALRLSAANPRRIQDPRSLARDGR